MRVPKKEIARTILTTEDILVKLVEHVPSEETSIIIRIQNILGYINVYLSCEGTPFETEELSSIWGVENDGDEETRAFLQSVYHKLIQNHVNINYRGKVVRAVVHVMRFRYRQLTETLGAVVLGLLAGILLKNFAPAEFYNFLSKNIFSSGSSLFLNALKTVTGPLVLFSIATSLSEFGNMKFLGKMARNIIGLYLLTSVIAIGIGFLVYQIFPIGDPALSSAITDVGSSTITTAQNTSVSIRDMLVNIIPKNIINPFSNVDMLQILFLGVLLGIGVSVLPDRNHGLRKILSECNTVVSHITTLIIRFLPIAVFCSMANMMLSIDYKYLFNLLQWVLVCYAGDILMIGVYMILLVVMARLNPIKFLKGYHSAMLTAYSLASSNATMPVSMKVCGEKLGIAKQLYSFSIPLGATIYMDGSCILMMVSCLFMAKIFGVAVTGGVLLGLIVSVLALSLGAPGVPGAALVCVSILLPQIGVPAEAISLIMGIYSLCGMSLVCVNCTGDAIATTIVAKHSGLLDVDKFNAN